MSSEFTIGLANGMRNSSKILKPPGGGSSDIFNLGASNDEDFSGKQKNVDTQERLFGVSGSGANTPPMAVKANRMHSNIFQGGDAQPLKKPTKKYGKCVRRNPITGEVIEIIENGNDTDKTLEEDDKVEEPPKPVVTSIRIRNPPGGKSSGIF